MLPPDDPTSPSAVRPSVTARRDHHGMRLLSAVLALVVLAVFSCNAPPAPPPEPNAVIYYGTVTGPVAVNALGSTISTYADDAKSIADPAGVTTRARLSELNLGACRVPIQWNGGNPVSSAGGGDRTTPAAAWIAGILAIGCEPVIVVGGSADNNWTAGDVAGLVARFPEVRTFILGNEPSGGVTAAFCDRIASGRAAAWAVDPDVTIGGPALAWYDRAGLQAFIQDPDCRGPIPGLLLVDWHNYGMGETALSTAAAMSRTGEHGTQIREVKGWLDAIGYGAARVGITEVNWSWRTGNGYTGSCDPAVVYPGDERLFCAETAVWGASVIGGIIAAGGVVNQYADLNGGLGALFSKGGEAAMFGRTVSSPMPVYWSLGMFTGAGRFRGWGTETVAATTTVPDVEIFAGRTGWAESDAVLVNKSETATREVRLEARNSLLTETDVWLLDRTDRFTGPELVGTVDCHGGCVLTLPPLSVTRLVNR